ncbi:MAG: hypothetical protein B6D64_00590 [Bacteroidetes bacterium 4484_276]|nr:MAG: hypothetical protein B6D64_00590 [Bacteroidetes bacterium 4484_276]
MENGNTDCDQAIYHFLETQLQLFRGYFLITQASMEEEAIHQMRVAIKRIRAIRKLKKHINFPSLLDDEQYAAIKTIFAVSGQMRDLQIQRNLLKGYINDLNFTFDDLAAHLEELENQLLETFRQTIQTLDFNQFNEVARIAEPLDGQEDRINLEKESVDFLHKKIGKINELILLMDKDEFVHALRKQIKQLYFILQFIKKHFPKNELTQYKLKALKNIGEHIGNWNDRDVFLNRIDGFFGSKDDKFPEGNAEYPVLYSRLEDEKVTILNGIKPELNIELTNLKTLLSNNNNK